jgi:hypothetical protein
MTETTPRPRRWGLIIPWAIAALIVIGWCGYWFTLREAALRELSTWSEEQVQAGGPQGYATVNTTGFPLRLELMLTDASFRSADGGLQATTPLARLAVNPVNPAHLIVTLPEPITYELHDGGPRILTAARLQASLRTQDNRLARFSLEGQSIRAAPPSAPTDQGLRAEQLSVHVQPDPRDAADWQVAARALNMSIASPVRGFEALGQTFPELTLGLVVTKAQALSDPAGAADPLLLWTQAGGEVRIETSEIVWGPARATGQGLLRLDAQRRLEGRLALRLDDAAALLEALGGGGGLTAILAQNLEISEMVFTAQGGTLFWQADTPLGDISPQAVRSLGPLYPAAAPQD